MCRSKLTKEQTCCRGTMSLQRNGCSTRTWFREFGKSLAELELTSSPPKKILTAQSFFTKSMDALAHEWPSLPLYAFPPSRSATAGIQASQGTTAQADSNSPPLEEPTVSVGVIPAAESSPVADPLERTARYGLHGLSYGPCMCGRSTGAFRPPRACLKHYGRSYRPVYQTPLRSEMVNFLGLVSRP